jgi:alpha-L-arabinofuranosidase
MPVCSTLFAAALAIGLAQDDSTLKVDAGKVVNRITPMMYGSCIEDVNHEIYGGLYAQMIFGESFEEPPIHPPAAGWTSFGGRWATKEGIFSAEADFGAKAVLDGLEVSDGTVLCDVRFRDEKGENAGLILRVREPKVGADAWIGYEVSLSAKHDHLMLGRHQNNFKLLKQVPARVDAGRWHRLRVELKGATIRISLDDAMEPAIVFTDDSGSIPGGRVGVRTWGSDVDYRDLIVERPEGKTSLRFEPDPKAEADGLSAMWDAVRTGDAVPRLTWDASRPFNTTHSQRIERAGGEGTVGIANRGLNRWGLSFRQGREYAGRVYLRGEGFEGKVSVALQSADGSRTYAVQELGKLQADWTRHEFALRPDASDANARFVLTIDGPAKVWVDQVYLSGTGDDLFKGLPIRGDIGRALQEQGLTLLRYGGSMINAPEYRWKPMIGDRDRRPQHRGTWYPWSTNGFGIEEFVQFCRAAGFEPVVAINIEETPQDAADLVDYLNAPATNRWGRRRAENGHPEPYGVRYIEIGNEETTNDHYIDRFKLLYDAMRPRDPKLELIIGAWWEPDNPVSRKIVRELDGKAALWDVHVGGDDPREGAKVDALFTRMEGLVADWAPGTRLKACVLEENGGRHDLARALGHAGILNATQRHGDFVLIDCPANCLQPWMQNDNGWDQGQLFFTSGRVWPMPPYHTQRMASSSHQPCRVASTASSPGGDLDLTATRDEAGTTVVLKVVNAGNQPHRASIAVDGVGPLDPKADVTTLSGALDARNTPESPDRIRPVSSSFDGVAARFSYEFPARSYSVLRLRRR